MSDHGLFENRTTATSSPCERSSGLTLRLANSGLAVLPCKYPRENDQLSSWFLFKGQGLPFSLVSVNIVPRAFSGLGNEVFFSATKRSLRQKYEALVS